MCNYSCTRWACDISNWKPTLSQLCQAIVTIQPEEHERIMRFHFFEDFLSSLVGRLLMRKYINITSGLSYNEIEFKRDERGKPYWHLNDAVNQAGLLKNPNEVSFNVSHQSGMVVLGGITTSNKLKDSTPNFGIGVDVMKIEYSGGKPLKEFFRLMHRKFSDSEWRYIIRGCEAHQLKSFMRHWCLKESYVKELGVGITIDLQKISFSVDQEIDLQMNNQPLSNTTLTCNNVPMTNWYFEEYLLKPEYCAALAFRNCKPSNIERFQFLNLDDIIVEIKNENKVINLVDDCKKALAKPRKNCL